MVVKYKEWTDEEDNFLIKNHGDMKNEEIAEELNRTPSSVSSRINLLRKRGDMDKNSDYPSEDILPEEYKGYFQKWYGIKSDDELSRELDTNPNKLKFASQVYEVKKTENRKRFIAKNHDEMSVEALAKTLGLTTSTIYSYLRDLGVDIEPKDKWTDEENEFIVNNRMDMTIKEMANELGRKYYATAKQISRLREQNKLRSNKYKKRGKNFKEKHKQILKEWYGIKTDKELSEELPIAESTISYYAYKYSVSKVENRKQWVRKNKDNFSLSEMSEKLGVSTNTIEKYLNEQK